MVPVVQLLAGAELAPGVAGDRLAGECGNDALFAGGGQVIGGAGQRRRGPDQLAVRVGQELDVPDGALVAMDRLECERPAVLLGQASPARRQNDIALHAAIRSTCPRSGTRSASKSTTSVTVAVRGRSADARLDETLGIADRGILRTAIRMMHQAIEPLIPGPDGHLQGIERQIGYHRGRRPPADNTPRETSITNAVYTIPDQVAQ